MTSKKSVTLYHGSNIEFDRFERCGVRSTSALGMGYYLTPRLEKAERYGDVVMVFEVDISNCLDWDNLSASQRREIEMFLSNHVPDPVLAKYGETQYEVVPLNAVGLARTEELQALTASNESHSSRAKMVAAYELPDHLKGIDRRKFGVVRWREAGCLDSANCEQLLALAQEYAPEIASHLGYVGAKFGDEVSIYRAELATKVGVLKEESKNELSFENKTGFWAAVSALAKEESQSLSVSEINPKSSSLPKVIASSIRMKI